MSLTVTALTDKDVYAKGETVTLTLTVVAEDPSPTVESHSGTFTMSDGINGNWTVEFMVDRDAPSLVSVSLADTVDGRVWSNPTISGNTATWTSIA
jgi:hypothetical protein